MTSLWETTATPPKLDPHAVHVFRAALDEQHVDRFGRLLSADEIARAERFHFERDRDRYVTGRGMLRLLLGQYLRCAPRAIEFAYGKYGKPAVAGTRPGGPIPHFNVSHSAAFAVYAFSNHGPVGVDLECIRPLADYMNIAARFFSPVESRALQDVREDRRLDAFYKCWTAKEAFVKAHGDGLAYALDRFEVEVRPDLPSRLLAIDGDEAAASSWTIAALAPCAGYAGALATPGHELQVHCYQWQPIMDESQPW